jgi:hypothetical protein
VARLVAGKPLRSRIPWHYALALILVLCCAIRLYFFVGVGVRDDMGYIEHARSLAQGYGIFGDNCSQLAFRIGMVFPLALLYRIFGLNEGAFSAFSCVSSLAACAFIFLTARRLWGYGAALFASILWLCYPLQIVHDTELSSSSQLAACSAGALYFFIEGHHVQEEEGAKRLAPLLFLICGFFLGLGFMVNELFSIMILAALPLLYIKRPALKPLGIIVCGFILLLLSEIVMERALGGQWCARIHTIVATEAAVSSSRDMSNLPRGLFKIRCAVLHYDEGWFGFLWYIFIGLSAAALLQKNREAAALSVGCWLVLAYLQWGVVSLDGTIITKYIRYLSLIVPLQCAAIGGILGSLSGKGRWPAALTVLIFSLLCGQLLFIARNVVDVERAYTDAYRGVTRYCLSAGLPSPLYADNTTCQFLELYSGGKLKVERVESYREKPEPLTGILVRDGSRDIVEVTKLRELTPPWFQHPPPYWPLIHRVESHSTIDFYSSFSPEIYLIRKRSMP